LRHLLAAKKSLEQKSLEQKVLDGLERISTLKALEQKSLERILPYAHGAHTSIRWTADRKLRPKKS
jgi:hypothetical protein